MTNEEGQEHYNETVPMPKAMNDDLVKYGYATGNYHAVCFDCKAQHYNSDKRSLRCKSCAQSLFIRDLELQLKQANDAGFNEGVEAAAGVVPLIYQKAISQLKRTQP